MNRNQSGVIRKIFYKLSQVYCDIILFYLLLFTKTDKNTWVFHSRHFLDANVKMFFHFIKDRSEIVKIFVFQGKKPTFTGQNIRFISVWSPKLPFVLAKSHKFFSSTASKTIPFQYIMKKKFFVQLWHGIPIKTIGYLAFGKMENYKYQFPYIDFLISSSQTDRLAMSLAFSPKDINKVHITGLPRNDILLEKNLERLPAELKVEAQKLQTLLNGRKMILYAPTWRESAEYYSFSGEECKQLEQFLKQNNAVFLFKPHSMTQYQKKTIFPEGVKNCLCVCDQEINILLRYTDILVSDYSSTVLDYLLLERPIIHFNYDFSNYSRGFIYNDKTILPGIQTQNFRELITTLKQQISSPELPEHYYEIKKLFHQYADTNNSERIFKILSKM